MPRIRTLSIAGPAGRLEAMLTIPERDPLAAGIVCHPHPLYGGTMQSKAVFRTARALVSQGLAVLRFNFRGVGASEGAHDEGRGEQDDVRAALDELEKLYPERPLVAAGYSFGAIMALSAGVEDARVRALLAVAFPVGRVTDTSFLDRCPKPILFVQGEEDEFGSIREIRALASWMPKTRSISIVASGDHLFTGKLDELERIVAAWAAEKPWEGTTPASG